MKYLFSFYLLFLVSLTFSQQYKIVHDHLPAYYGSQEIRAFALDSVVNMVDYQIYYCFSTIKDTSEWMGGQCMDAQAGSIMGRVIVQGPEKTSILNFRGDSIHYFQQTVPGELYVFYTWPNGDYIEAFHFQNDYQNVLGVMDSVKLFRLQVFNSGGDSIYSPYFNGQTFGLSKNYGLLSSFDNYLIPFHSFQRELSGFSSPSTGIQSIDWKDAFSMETGDEFHIREEKYYWAWDEVDSTTVQGNITSDYIRIVQNREDFTDSIRFTYLECWRIVDASPLGIDTTFIADTVVYETIQEQSYQWMDLYPDQYYGDWEGYSYISQEQSNSYNGHPIKSIMYDYIAGIDEVDSCLQYTIFCPEHMVNTYIDGCGGPYYSYYIEFTMPSRSLKYFRKGNEEWGVRFAADCEDLLTSTAEFFPKQTYLLVYPNPFINQLTISCTAGLINKCNIYNTTGRLVDQIRINNSTYTENTSRLLPGIYLMEIQMDDGHTRWKKLIRK